MQGNSITEEAIRCGVAPLLYKCLVDSSHEESFSREATESLRDVYLHNALRNKTIWQELATVLNAFRKASISVIVLKGAHLAELVYGSPALRPMADLDLLVRERDLTRAERCLCELGYGRSSEENDGPDRVDYSLHHHLRPFVKPGAVPVEIHRHITTESDILKITADPLWECAEDAVIAGVPTQVLSPEHLLLHLCLHTAYNHKFQVPHLYFCDIAWSVARYRKQIDWPCVAAIAEEWGVSRLVYSTLLLVEETLGLGMEFFELDAFHHEAVDRDGVATLREFLFTPQQELPFAYQEFRERHGLRERVRTLARNLFPARTRMCRIYGLPTKSSRVFLYYLFRPIDLLVRRGRFMLELICRTEGIQLALKQEEKRLQIRHWLEGCVGARPED